MLALVLSGSGPVLLRNPIFPCFFEGAGGGGGVGPLSPTLNPHMQSWPVEY